MVLFKVDFSLGVERWWEGEVRVGEEIVKGMV